MAIPEKIPPLQEEKSDALLAQVEGRRREIRTDSYGVSIGELATLYSDGEMIINPSFQRFFRWTDWQKTSLVESILLGIPLPPIFVSTDQNGVWEVVDGLQRLSTIFQVMGKLKPEHNRSASPMRFTRAKYLEELEGRGWDDLPKPLQLDFRRARIDVNIILRDEDQRAKYDLFERLNSGGAHLSEQELRNCLLVMENEAFYNWLVELSEYPAFQACAAVSDRYEDQGYHKELVSRMLIFSDMTEESLKKIGDMGPFINEEMLKMANEDPAHWEARAKVFKDTFTILGASDIGDLAFKRYAPVRERFKGAFLISPFEVVACGIAYHLGRGAKTGDFPTNAVLNKIKGMWEDGGEMENIKAAGRKGANRLPRTIPYGRELFSPHT